MEPRCARPCAGRARPPRDDRDAELGRRASPGVRRRPHRPVCVSQAARAGAAAGAREVAREPLLLRLGGARRPPRGPAGTRGRDPCSEQALAHSRDAGGAAAGRPRLSHDSRRLDHQRRAGVPAPPRPDAARLWRAEALAGVLRGLLRPVREGPAAEALLQARVPLLLARQPAQAARPPEGRRGHRREPGDPRHLRALRAPRGRAARPGDLQRPACRRAAAA